MSRGKARSAAKERAVARWDLGTNALVLEREVQWFRRLLELRLERHAGESEARAEALWVQLPPPDLPLGGSSYVEVLRRFELGPAARLVLLLALLPDLEPDVLDPFFIQNRVLGRSFTEFGGLVGASHSGFLPTGQTALFLIAGDHLRSRLAYRELFHPDHLFYACGILSLDRRNPEEPSLAAALRVTPEYRERLLSGRSYHPPFSAEFPAQRIHTSHTWEDLVLPSATLVEVEDIVAWAQHHQELLHDWGLETCLKPGFRSLFYGPPGTGKTLTACLLGQAIGSSVYRVDLSKVISKYIGETEKNLANLFDHAQFQNWILFFDEADSLFGKRTDSRNANDRAANQQVAYLLQRIEDFPGIVILATNLRHQLDEAFARRFQSMIHFPIPEASERLRLWRGFFLDRPFVLAPDVDLEELARSYELAGGSIVNVLRYSCLKAITSPEREVRREVLLEGIQRELRKEGKFLRGGR